MILNGRCRCCNHVLRVWNTLQITYVIFQSPGPGLPFSVRLLTRTSEARRCALSLGRSWRTRAPPLSVFFPHLPIHRRAHQYPPSCLIISPHISPQRVTASVLHDSISARISPSSVLYRNQLGDHLVIGDKPRRQTLTTAPLFQASFWKLKLKSSGSEMLSGH